MKEIIAKQVQPLIGSLGSVNINQNVGSFEPEEKEEENKDA